LTARTFHALVAAFAALVKVQPGLCLLKGAAALRAASAATATAGSSSEGPVFVPVCVFLRGYVCL
jgi:hypothetical protein